MPKDNGDPIPLECEERASMAAQAIYNAIAYDLSRPNWSHRIATSPVNEETGAAYIQIDIVAPDEDIYDLSRLQPVIQETASGYGGDTLESNIVPGPLNADGKDPELYGLTVGGNQVSLYTAIEFNR